MYAKKAIRAVDRVLVAWYLGFNFNWDGTSRAMAVTSEQSAPYPAPGVFIPLLERNRERGLPNPLTSEHLQRLGVSDSLVPRTLQAFKTLDLIEEDGRHCAILERLRRAPEAEYKPLMAEWLKAAYAHALDVIDPATADEVAIRDAFRHYNPISMQQRMVSLFIALFETAGVRVEASKPAPKKTQPAAAPRQASKPISIRRGPAAQSSMMRTPTPPVATGLHPALAGLLAGLPTPGQSWTQADRDRFVAAFGVVLDFAHPPGLIAPVQSESAEADDDLA
jgi:hypothetical protein